MKVEVPAGAMAVVNKGYVGEMERMGTIDAPRFEAAKFDLAPLATRTVATQFQYRVDIYMRYEQTPCTTYIVSDGTVLTRQAA